MTGLNAEFESCRNIFDNQETFVLTTHISPDGDGLGSELALAHFLERRGKSVHIVNHSPLPSFYEFLDSGRRVQQFQSGRHEGLVASADVIMILDANQPDRLAGLKDPVLRSRAKKIVLDHHPDAARFADVYVIDEGTSATGEIVYRLLEYLDGPRVSKEIAEALYVAIMTDTGSFRFPKTDADLHRMVATLIECGADPVELYQQVYDQGTIGKIRLLGRVLSELQTHEQGKVAYLTVSQQMFKETGTTEPDTDNFVPYSLGIEGVQIGLMFTELPDQIKISFRSKGDIWINKLAQEFGGNGHKNAAGARVPNGVLRDVIARVLERTHHYVKT